MSDASFADIPEELQIDILSRLPRKPLSRCKCVSKHWNDTLTIQAFMLKHSRSYDKHSKLAFVAHRPFNEKTFVLSFDLSNRTSSRTMEIIGRRDRFTDTLFDNYICNDMSNICNELVCLYKQFSTLVGLLNIRTHEFIHLPAVTIQRLGPGILGPNIFLYALGYDPLSKVYKVLSIYGGRYVCRTKAAIFTLGSKHWKPVEYKFLNCWRCNNKLCLDGVIYWVNDYQIHGANVLTVVAFDLNRELFIDYELVSIPYNKVHLVKYYLTSLKGNPSLFIWKEDSDEIQQLTLFNHKNPKAAWNTRSFIAHDFPKNFPYGCLQTCVAGDSIVLRPIKSSVEPQEQYKSHSSWYRWCDLEKFAVE